MHVATADLVVHLTIMLAWIGSLWLGFSYGARVLEERFGPPSR